MIGPHCFSVACLPMLQTRFPPMQSAGSARWKLVLQAVRHKACDTNGNANGHGYNFQESNMFCLQPTIRYFGLPQSAKSTGPSLGVELGCKQYSSYSSASTLFISRRLWHTRYPLMKFVISLTFKRASRAASVLLLHLSLSNFV